MRTTLTVDDDLMRALREEALESGLPLKRVVNRALRRGLGRARPSPRHRRYRSPTYALGRVTHYDLDKALALASSLEDAETARDLELRK
jgi:hypothetical protein